MILAAVFFICLGASVIGAVCGVGGGIIIKPVLDAFGIMDVATISFLSGCTVLSMTAYSVAKSLAGGKSRIERHTGFPLALGAAVGGVVGKRLFDVVRMSVGNPQFVGAVQAVCLIVMTAGTLLYTLNKHRIVTHRMESRVLSLCIGLALGIMSSFLGIGGGPVNLVVLYYFFSMDSKTAAENSLYMILFSQIAAVLVSMVTGSVPDFDWWMLALMAGGGICGGILGRKLNQRITGETVDKLFIALLALMVMLNVFNLIQYI